MVMPSLHRNNGGDIRELCSQMLGDKRLILAGNRGPVEHRFDEDGEIESCHGCGGVAPKSTREPALCCSRTPCAVPEGYHQIDTCACHECLLNVVGKSSPRISAGNRNGRGRGCGFRPNRGERFLLLTARRTGSQEPAVGHAAQTATGSVLIQARPF